MKPSGMIIIDHNIKTQIPYIEVWGNTLFYDIRLFNGGSIKPKEFIDPIKYRDRLNLIRLDIEKQANRERAKYFIFGSSITSMICVILFIILFNLLSAR